jgi:hypothetical protein
MGKKVIFFKIKSNSWDSRLISPGNGKTDFPGIPGKTRTENPGIETLCR